MNFYFHVISSGKDWLHVTCRIFGKLLTLQYDFVPVTSGIQWDWVEIMGIEQWQNFVALEQEFPFVTWCKLSFWLIVLVLAGLPGMSMFQWDTFRRCPTLQMFSICLLIFLFIPFTRNTSSTCGTYCRSQPVENIVCWRLGLMTVVDRYSIRYTAQISVDW